MKAKHLHTLFASALLVAVSGCDMITGTRASQPVDVMVAARTTPALASTISRGALDITKLEIVLGQASLGNGDQFGCQDCQDASETAAVTPRVFSVPLDGGAVRVASERVGPGVYKEVEIEVTQLAAASGGAPADWPSGATIRVSGLVDSAPFSVTLNQGGDLRQVLPVPINVADRAAPTEIQAVLNLPVLTWFFDGSRELDPRVAADLALIKQHVLATLDTSDVAEDGGKEDGGR